VVDAARHHGIPIRIAPDAVEWRAIAGKGFAGRSMGSRRLQALLGVGAGHVDYLGQARFQ